MVRLAPEQCGSLRAAVDVELLQDAVDMVFNRRRANHELGRDLLVRQTSHEQCRDLALARRQSGARHFADVAIREACEQQGRDCRRANGVADTRRLHGRDDLFQGLISTHERADSVARREDHNLVTFDDCEADDRRFRSCPLRQLDHLEERGDAEVNEDGARGTLLEDRGKLAFVATNRRVAVGEARRKPIAIEAHVADDDDQQRRQGLFIGGSQRAPAKAAATI
jgi:hypothetical protein